MIRPIRPTLRTWMIERFMITPYLVVGTNCLNADKGYYRIPYDVRKYVATFLVPELPLTLEHNN